MRLLLASAAFLGLLQPSAALADNIVLQPSSSWHLDYGEDKCRLARSFGEGENRVMLLLDQHQPSDTFTWTAAGPPVTTFASGRKFTAQFGPAMSLREIEPSSSTFSGELEGHGKAVIIHGHLGDAEFKAAEAAQEAAAKPIGLPQLDAAGAKGMEWLELRRGRGNSLRLATGPMGPTFKALNNCMANLVTHWGLDAEQQARRVTGPEWTNAPQVARKIQQTYPLQALRQGKQARMHIRVMVDATGKATRCVRTDVTTADDFTDKPCQIIMRDSEFQPARDASGAGVPSYYATSVVYAIG